MSEPDESVWAPLDGFVDGWNRHDIAAWEPLFTPDADFVNVAGRRMSGWPEIHAIHAAAHAAPFRDSVLSSKREDAALLSDGVALVHVTTGITGDLNPDGTPRPPRSTYLTVVLRGTPGTWRIRAVHNTNIIPPG